jgi:hypothetical protein
MHIAAASYWQGPDRMSVGGHRCLDSDAAGSSRDCAGTPSSVTQRQAVCVRDSSSPLADRDNVLCIALKHGAPCNGLGQTTPPDRRRESLHLPTLNISI